MASKRQRVLSVTGISTQIPNQWQTYQFLYPNDCLSIGIHHYLIRRCPCEHYEKFFYQKDLLAATKEDFLQHLNDLDQNLQDNSSIDIERVALSTRLRHYLMQNNNEFDRELDALKNHVRLCLTDQPVPYPSSEEEFLNQSVLRINAAEICQLTYRKLRLEYCDNINVSHLRNVLTLQNSVLHHLHWLLQSRISSIFQNDFFFNDQMRVLLHNGFLIIQEPSPPVALHSSIIKGPVKVKLSCKILCLFDQKNNRIIIDNVEVSVRRVRHLNQSVTPEFIYPTVCTIPWNHYSVVTHANERRNFLCAELKEFILTESIRPREIQEKKHYAQSIYCLDFSIKVRIFSSDNNVIFEHPFVLSSSPFGLISNTSQEADRLAHVLVEDRRGCQLFNTSWSLEGYFIYKTGIRPQPWVREYMMDRLAAQQTPLNPLSSSYHNLLAKFLAQIQFLTEHPLLIQFHYDGLFLGICDSNRVDHWLRNVQERSRRNLLSIRFGLIDNMKHTTNKDVGVRIDFLPSSSNEIKRFTFPNDRLAQDLGSFITRIERGEFFGYEFLQPEFSVDLRRFVDFYHSSRLREVCSFEEYYQSRWESITRVDQGEFSSHCIVLTHSDQERLSDDDIQNIIKRIHPRDGLLIQSYQIQRLDDDWTISPQILMSFTGEDQGLQITVITGLCQCYEFLSPNEYSKNITGPLSILFRSFAGENVFFGIVDQATNAEDRVDIDELLRSLRRRRQTLLNNEVTCEKNPLLSRLISSIEENRDQFQSTIEEIRNEMKNLLMDPEAHQSIVYPENFRKREKDFINRRNAQNIRRLFYLDAEKARYPPNILVLQKRTTAHLTHLLQSRMRYDSSFFQLGFIELDRMIDHSFLILQQPHTGMIPVTIYEKGKPKLFSSKVSVVIVSLLHEFMAKYPNYFTLGDIHVRLCPSSDFFRLNDPVKLAWKICQLHISPGSRPQHVLYAEFSTLVIEQIAQNINTVHFARELLTLEFDIELKFVSHEFGYSKTFHQTLKSLPFSIGNHNSQTPELISRILLEDMQRFTRVQELETKVLSNFLRYYFAHRTGVIPNDCLRLYLELELNRTRNERQQFHTMKDIYTDFLIEFVHQVEFIGKHPLLSLFLHDGLFLGICNGVQAEEALRYLYRERSSFICLRMNSVTIEYKKAASRAIKPKACQIRAHIFNNPCRNVQHYTFHERNVFKQLVKFICSTQRTRIDHIHFVSDWRSSDQMRTTCCSDFRRYYHDSLREWLKNNEKLKNVTNIFQNIESDDDDDECINDMLRNDSTNPIHLSSLDDTSSNETTSIDFLPLMTFFELDDGQYLGNDQ